MTLKKIVILLMSFGLLFTGCASKDVTDISQTETTSVSEDTEQYIPETPEPYKSYIEVVETFVNDETHPLPGQDHDDNWINENEDISKNKFAILDINGDGEEELIIQVITTVHANWSDNVYRFNPDTNTVDLIHVFFADSTYYSNGIAEDPVANNQGSSIIWPYTMWQYNPETFGYDEIGFVNSEAKEYMLDPSSFPFDLDKDKDGVIYEIQEKINDETTNYIQQLDEAAYMIWKEKYIMNATPIEIEWHSVTVY